MSPIADVTDRRPTRLVVGSLHKGAKQPKDPRTGRVTGFAKDLDGWFRFESRFDDMTASFARLYGAEPRELLCILDGDTTDEAFDAWHESYNGQGQLVHRCDGQRLVFLRDRDNPSGQRWPMERVLDPDDPPGAPPRWRATGPACDFAGMRAAERKKAHGACSQRGRLKLLPIELLPDGRPHYERRLSRVGQIVCVTYSIYDILHLSNILNSVVEQHGRLRGIPFTLRREQRPVPIPNADGTAAMKDRWMLDLVPDPRWQLIQVEAAYERAIKMLESPEMLALAGGDDEPDDQPAEQPADQQVDRSPPVRIDITPAGKTVDADTGEILDEHPRVLEADPSDDPADEEGDGDPPHEEYDDDPEYPEEEPADFPPPVAEPEVEAAIPPEFRDPNRDVASPAQVRTVYLLGRERGMSEEEIDAKAVADYGYRVHETTKRQASQLITDLKMPGSKLDKPRPPVEEKPAAPAKPARPVAGGSSAAVTPSRSGGRKAEQLLANFLNLRARVGAVGTAFALSIPLVDGPPEAASADDVEACVREQLFYSIDALEKLADAPARAQAPVVTQEGLQMAGYHPPTEQLGAYHRLLVAAVAGSKGLDAATLEPVPEPVPV